MSLSAIRLLSVTALTGLASLSLAAPALAAPPSRGVTAGGISLSCVGDTISGQLRASGPVGTLLTVSLVGGRDLGHPQAIGAPDVAVLSGSTVTYSFRFDVAGSNAKLYRVVATDAAGHTVARSRALPASACAPGSEVPEAPAAALIPLSMLGTLGGVALTAARRRRRTEGSATA